MKSFSVSIFIALLAITLFSGCATQSAPTRQLGGIKIVEGPSTADLKDFTPKRRGLFEAALEKELYDSDSGFTRGNNYTLTWTVLNVDEGSGALRFFGGNGSGRGVLDVLVQVTDAKGKVIGVHESTGMEDSRPRSENLQAVCEDAGTEAAQVAQKIVINGG